MPIEGPSRRAVLAGSLAVAGTLTGCLPGSDEPLRERADGPVARPQLRRAVDEIEQLAAQYEAAQLLFPDPTGMLVLFAAEHRAHAAALSELSTRRVVGSSSGSASTGARNHHSSAKVAAGTPEDARAQLVAAELAASQRRAEEAARDVPGAARLLASISACNAAHAALLEARPPA